MLLWIHTTSFTTFTCYSSDRSLRMFRFWPMHYVPRKHFYSRVHVAGPRKTRSNLRFYTFRVRTRSWRKDKNIDRRPEEFFPTWIDTLPDSFRFYLPSAKIFDYLLLSLYAMLQRNKKKKGGISIFEQKKMDGKILVWNIPYPAIFYVSFLR